MKVLQEQYNLIKEGKGNKAHFLKTAFRLFPDMLSPVNTYEDTVHILKNRSIISEGIGGVVTTGKTPDWHQIFKENINSINEEELPAEKELKALGVKYELSGNKVSPFKKVFKPINKDDSFYRKFNDVIDRHNLERYVETSLNEAKEAKAEEKEATKEVTDMETAGYNYKDKKNYDNVFGEEFLKGFYTEMGDSKNEGKTVEELRQIVAKNLSKDMSYYVKDGQFGLKGVGYETELPGLGTPKEAKGKFKSSGYGDLKEGKDISIKGKTVKNAKQNGDKSYTVTYEDDTTSNVAVSNDAWDDLNDKYGDIKKSLKESVLRAFISEMIKEALAEAKPASEEDKKKKKEAEELNKEFKKRLATGDLDEALKPEDEEMFSKATDVAEKLYDKLGNIKAVLAKIPSEYASFKDELEQHLIQKYEG